MFDTETTRVCFGERLADLPEVRLAFLFGSRARGSERPGGDVDIAVLPAEVAVQDAPPRADRPTRTTLVL